MDETTSGIRAVLAELESAVERELPGWPAEMKARYRTARREWDEAVRRMPECLDRARQAVREIAGEEPDRGR
ncbi:WXG100 family type VII secretion target [Amycolatopsis jiangsuensis]|uniref:Uncharacterized protein YukE n=1 Tax=Amycolatopsis jiangsuensis TaxID=1181879 RepID=A0A840J305_9PSEU|nr:hypothetical protein [Amycolatopsis jiangsuensis]MBB4688440.1 uncharacterized protein YukE [Amycolatopsis jiangsuensis]